MEGCAASTAPTRSCRAALKSCGSDADSCPANAARISSASSTSVVAPEVLSARRRCSCCAMSILRPWHNGLLRLPFYHWYFSLHDALGIELGNGRCSIAHLFEHLACLLTQERGRPAWHHGGV